MGAPSRSSSASRRAPAPSAPPDPLFTDAAQSLSELIQATAESARRLKLAPGDTFDLLRAALSREQVFPKPNPSAQWTKGEAIGEHQQTGPVHLLHSSTGETFYPVAAFRHRHEVGVLYTPSDFFGIFNDDGSFAVTRVD